MARLILDAGVLVAVVRGRLGLDVVTDTDDVAVPAIVLAEYGAGVLRDPDPGRQAAQRAFLDDLLNAVPVVDHDRTVAAHHAALLAHVREAGRPRGAHDLIVAACARATRRTVLTTDAGARFDELPEVRARLVRADGG